MRKPVSVTLDTENLLWLKGQAIAKKQNVSRVLDGIIREARQGGAAHLPRPRSVKGTIGPLPDDAELAQARDEVRAMFEESLARPLYVRERPVPLRHTRTKRRA